MAKQNCWEFKKCGREINGANVDKYGICPAADNVSADGFCGGKNGGRACVYIIGTLCDGVCQMSLRNKEKACDECEFHIQLKKEHSKEMNIFAYLEYVNKDNKKLSEK